MRKGTVSFYWKFVKRPQTVDPRENLHSFGTEGTGSAMGRLGHWYQS